jgi:hypothetical protein
MTSSYTCLIMSITCINTNIQTICSSLKRYDLGARTLFAAFPHPQDTAVGQREECHCVLLQAGGGEIHTAHAQMYSELKHIGPFSRRLCTRFLVRHVMITLHFTFQNAGYLPKFILSLIIR